MPLDPSIILGASRRNWSLSDLLQQQDQKVRQDQLLAMQQQRFDAERADREQATRENQLKQQREQAGMIAKLTHGVTDEATYQQRLAAARTYGVDVSGAPANYDPNWVQTQNILAETFYRDGPDKLTTTAQELKEAGLKPGTPEFERAMAQRIRMQDSKVITTSEGGSAGLYGSGGYEPILAPNPGGQPFGAPVQQGGGKTVVRTGKDAQGRQVVQYSDGTIDYAGGAGGNASGGFRGSFSGLPGETVTSTRRSAAHNRAVGGVPNSYHLTGQARDSVPPRGMSMAAYAAELQRRNPHMEVINEGDHVHMEPRG